MGSRDWESRTWDQTCKIHFVFLKGTAPPLEMRKNFIKMLIITNLFVFLAQGEIEVKNLVDLRKG